MIKNRYIVISILFMMLYLLDKFIVKQENPALYKALIANLGNLFDTEIGSMLLVFGGATVLILVLCRFYLGRKCDCGEE